LETPRGSFSKTASDDALQRCGDFDGQFRRLGAEDGIAGLDRRLPFEGALSGEHLVKDGAEAEEIGPLVHRPARTCSGDM